MKNDKNLVAVVAPREAWELLEETLQTDTRAANFDLTLRGQIKSALRRITVTSTNHPMFTFRSFSRTVKGAEEMRWVVQRLVQAECLFSVVPLPDDEYEIFVREDMRAALAAAIACRPYPVAPDSHLEEAYENNVSGFDQD